MPGEVSTGPSKARSQTLGEGRQQPPGSPDCAEKSRGPCGISVKPAPENPTPTTTVALESGPPEAASCLQPPPGCRPQRRALHTGLQSSPGCTFVLGLKAVNPQGSWFCLGLDLSDNLKFSSCPKAAPSKGREASPRPMSLSLPGLQPTEWEGPGGQHECLRPGEGAAQEPGGPVPPKKLSRAHSPTTPHSSQSQGAEQAGVGGRRRRGPCPGPAGEKLGRAGPVP